MRKRERPRESTLVRLSTDELELIRLYRQIPLDHRDFTHLYLQAAVRRYAITLPSNVIALRFVKH